MRTIIFLLTLTFSTAYSQYTLQTEHLGGARNAQESNTFRAVLLYAGAPVATVERTLPFDVPYPSSWIEPSTGIFVLSYTFDGFVEVYNSKGKKQWEQNFFKEAGPNYERTITAALGINSIVFLTSDVTLPNALVHKYSVSGRKEWETPLPHPMGFEIAMSKDERTIVAGSYFVLEDDVRRTASVLNAAGAVNGTADILFRNAAFSDDGTLIALASEREVSLFSLPLRKETARSGAAPAERIINGLVWQGEEIIVQESAVRTTPDHQFYFASPLFIRYDASLTERSRRMLETIIFKRSSLSAGPDGVELRYDGRSLMLSR